MWVVPDSLESVTLSLVGVLHVTLHVLSCHSVTGGHVAGGGGDEAGGAGSQGSSLQAQEEEELKEEEQGQGEEQEGQGGVVIGERASY